MEWQMQRVPARAEGYSLDLDSTIFERYGRQEGSLKGHNPRKHGRRQTAEFHRTALPAVHRSHPSDQVRQPRGATGATMD